MAIPTTTCPLTSRACEKNRDCSECDIFKATAPQVEWVCALCTLDARRAFPGAVPDIIAIPGVYSSGVCPRCGEQRLALLALKPRTIHE